MRYLIKAKGIFFMEDFRTLRMNAVTYLAAWLILPVALISASATADTQDTVQQDSQGIAEKHGHTTPPFPFIARYNFDDHSLQFVAANHVFTPVNSTFSLINQAFEWKKPGILIVEGFPTKAGKNPKQVVQAAQNRLQPNSNAYTRGEAMYAVSLALEKGVPFLGGEPTEEEEVEHLTKQGYSREEISFYFFNRELSQARRANEWSTGEERKLEATFTQSRGGLVRLFGTSLMNFSEYKTYYSKQFGIEPVADANFDKRTEPGIQNRIEKLIYDDGKYRDQNVLAVVEDQLKHYQHVLVVYGNGHWISGKEILQDRYGVPAITTLDSPAE